MRKYRIPGLILACLLIPAIVLAAYESNRFRGAGYDGSDQAVEGSYNYLNCSYARTMGGGYDGYANQPKGSYDYLNSSYMRTRGSSYDGYANQPKGSYDYLNSSYMRTRGNGYDGYGKCIAEAPLSGTLFRFR